MTQQPSALSDLQQVEHLLGEKNYPDALAILRSFWLENPSDTQAIRLLSRLMKSLKKNELSGSLYKLAEPEAMEHDVQNLFEAGFKLIDERELQLAVMLLERCINRMPDQATVAYELGFALMALHRFNEAIPHFQKTLEEKQDFDTSLNLTVCFTLTRRMQEAHALVASLEKLASNDDEKGEIEQRKVVLKRLESFQKKEHLTPRDWLYTLYGTLVLSEPNPTEFHPSTKLAAMDGLFADTLEKCGSNTPDYKAVAWTLVVLEKLLGELGFEFDVVEFYSPMSRPLAEAMAHIMNLPAKSFRGADSKDRSLMLMCWAPNIIGPHKSFLNNNNRVLFSYGISTVQPLPLTPDLVGELCTDCQMPWAQSSEEDANERSNQASIDIPDAYQAKAMDRILEQVSELESRPEIIQTVQELAAYYSPKRSSLVVGNTRAFPKRPEYTAEVLI